MILKKSLNKKIIISIGFVVITLFLSILVLKDLGNKNLNESNDNYINGSITTNNDSGIFFASPHSYYRDEYIKVNSFFDKLIKFNSQKNELEEIIVDSKVECIKAIDDWIYFVGEDKCIYKVKDDGSSKIKLSDKEVYYSEIYIDNNWVYFISENIPEKVGRSIYRVKADGLQEQKILTNKELVREFLVENNILFYVKDSNNNLQLIRYDILNEEEIILFEKNELSDLFDFTKHGESIYYKTSGDSYTEPNILYKYGLSFNTEHDILYEYDLRTGSSKEIEKGIYSYNIENNQKIFYSNDEGLFVKDLRDGEEKTIISTKDIIIDINIAGESIFYRNLKYLGKDSSGEDIYSRILQLNTVKKDGTNLHVIDDVFNLNGNKRYNEIDFTYYKFKVYYPLNFRIDEVKGFQVLFYPETTDIYAYISVRNFYQESIEEIKPLPNSETKVEEIMTNEGLKGYIEYTEDKAKNELYMMFITVFDGKKYEIVYHGEYDEVILYKEMLIDTAKQIKIKSYEN